MKSIISSTSVRFSLVFSLFSPLFAQDGASAEKQMEALLKSNVSLDIAFKSASRNALSLREAPGIVSVITREEIQSSGATDLMDVLLTVPGISFGVDLQGVIGLSMRGTWAHEGKALLLLDGIEINEPLYGTNQLGTHFPVNDIECIEIIRGPGSAIYGGCAELCVINIKTRTAKELHGESAYLSGSKAKGGSANGSYGMYSGRTLGNFSYNVSAFAGNADRSTRLYTDVNGNQYDTSRQSGIGNTCLNVGMAWKGLRYRGLLDNYQVQERDHYDAILGNPIRNEFATLAHLLQYESTFGEENVLTAFVGHKRQQPWQYFADSGDAYDRTIKRTTGGLTYSRDLGVHWNIMAGGEFTRDHADQDRSGARPRVAAATYTNQAYFMQGMYSGALGTFTAGARFDKHSQAGSSFSPRLAFTKAWTLTHVKLLYAKAFHAPMVENIQTNPQIQPETTTTMEAEVGFAPLAGLYLSTNVFKTDIKSPIIYGNNNGQGAYINFGQLGTRGVEVSAQWAGTFGRLRASYSYSQMTNTNVSTYLVPGQPKESLGIPAHKAVFSAGIRLSPSWELSPTVTYLGKRYAYDFAPATQGLSHLRAEISANVFLRYQHLVSGFSVQAGVQNIGSAKVQYAQPYNSGHAPLPGMPWEAVLKVGYRL